MMDATTPPTDAAAVLPGGASDALVQSGQTPTLDATGATVPRTSGQSRIVHFALGALLVVQGLAHAAAGTWASQQVSDWFATPTWAAAMLGFMAGGFGLWGAPPLARAWRHFVVIGALASLLLVLLGTVGIPLFALGIAADLAIVLTVFEQSPDEGEPRRLRLRARMGGAFALACLAYVGAAVLLRPWHVRWGTTAEERAMRLPGDEIVPDARYRMDRAITIAAPSDSVWPWIAQLGQDRGGFYSYERLERMVGDDVTNADRVHPEWQHRQVGDLVRAAQPDYLGGRFGPDPGWRILQWNPPHALVLEGWGAFVVRPQPDGTTRLHIRLRGEGRPSLLGVVLGPLTLLAFEPAHFIMERGMLRGIRTRAEQMMVQSP